MRVDPGLLSIVMFLCQEREDQSGIVSKSPSATAFLVRIEETYGENILTWKYLVTARHNIERATNPIYVRYNRRSGQLDHLETFKAGWFSSDDNDVACLPFWTPERTQPEIDHASILLGQLVGRNSMFSGPPLTPESSPISVALGGDLAFVGLFSKHSGVSRNLPIVRFGNISAMPADKIKLTVGGNQNSYSFNVVGYLAECRSWGGHSGSPVLWNATVMARPIEAPGMKQAKQPLPLNGLLGLVSGHFDIEQKATTTGDVLLGEIQTAINSGIAVVTPASAITNLLMREDVVEERRT